MKYKLSDICLINKRSYSTKDSYKFVNYLDTGNMTKNSISQIQYIDLSSTKLPSRAKRVVQRNDIIYSTVRPNQEHYGFIKDMPSNFLVSTGFTVLTPNQEKVEPYWLYCYLTQKRITDQMQLIAEQNVSTYPSIRPENLAEIELDLPNLETQKKIVRILSALDQKIELNNQQNNTLFDSVRAIFRNNYYQKGNDCSLSDYILTEINGDWGKDEKEENTEKAYCIRGADIPDMEYGNKGNAPSRYILEKRLEKKSLSEDNIIIEISGGSPTQSTGRTAYITQRILDMYNAPLLCTNFCKAIKVKNKIFAPFIYMYLKLLYEDGVLFNWENGTTGIKNLALSSLLSNTKVQSLNDKEARRFYDQFYAIVNRISKNSAEKYDSYSNARCPSS